MAPSTLIDNLLNGFSHISAAPFQNLEIWWYLFPILALWITLEFYFGFYKSEKMGWNTALGNAFSFAWVSIEGMRVLFEKSLDLFLLRFGILSLAIAYSVFIIYLVFTHKIKDKYAFLAASPSLTYYLSAVSILWMHGLIIIDLWVLIDLIILFFVTMLLFMLIKKILPQKAESNNSGNDDYKYDKVGFDETKKESISETENTTKPSTNKENSDSPLDFMNFK
ncbi:hypothetical protein CL619_02695 [archaeon]|nr:hypothetical protein [archaeon]|tara:strand:+ start:1568 stop:2236 length:669 start_codon:yes stop_codon:yes gene_type:complete